MPGGPDRRYLVFEALPGQRTSVVRHQRVGGDDAPSSTPHLRAQARQHDEAGHRVDITPDLGQQLRDYARAAEEEDDTIAHFPCQPQHLRTESRYVDRDARPGWPAQLHRADALA